MQVPHYGISHRVSIPTSNGISPIEAVLIQERDDPFHIAIGHEMNHLEHREDGSNTGGLRIDFRENEESKEKADSSRVNNKSVWPNPEEHRNAFGLADPGSELNARMKAGLHLRYPDDTDEPFIEPVKTVLRNAVKSERYIEGTRLPPLSVEEWVRRLVDLRDRLDALPSAPFSSFTTTTTSSRGTAASSSSSGSSSSSTMTSSSSSSSSSNEHLTNPAAFADASAIMLQPISGSTKIKLLPYLLNGDYSSIPNKYKEQMLKAQIQKRQSKGKPTPWNDLWARITKRTERRFSMMMDTISAWDFVLFSIQMD